MQRASIPIVALLVLLGASPAAAQAPTPIDPIQQATFRIFLRGVPVGNEQFTVSQAGDRWVISATSRLDAPVNLTLRKAVATYDATWQALALTLDGTFRDQIVQLATTVTGTQASSTFDDGGKTVEKTDTVSPGTVLLPNNFYASYAALAVRLATQPTVGDLRIYVAPQAEIGVKVGEARTERFQAGGRSFLVRQQRLVFQNPGGPLDVDLWFEEDGKLARVSIPSVTLDVVREDLASVSARAQRFTREGDEDVRIPAAGFTLAGTISMPRAAAPPAAPAGGKPAAVRYPTIVLVAGSGPLDRDETVAGIPIFGQLSAALADAGYLVLRYDKRGTGLSGGRLEAVTLNDYAEDVRSIVAWLGDRKDVDRSRLAVVGHSEGGWVALLAASREKRIRAVVTLSTPGTTGAALVLEQQKRALERSTFSDADKQAKTALQEKIQQAVTTGKGWDEVPAELRKQADTPWFASLLAFDPSKVVSRVGQPVLIVQAARDTQVPPHHATDLATLARARKKDPGTEVVTIDGVNHLFVPAESGEVEEYAKLTAREISPEAARAILTWLQKVLVPAR